MPFLPYPLVNLAGFGQRLTILAKPDPQSQTIGTCVVDERQG